MSELTTTQEELTTTPNKLLELAINANADIDKLERLMALQERWEAKNAERSFNIAMAEFQKRKPNLVKTKDVEYNNKKAYSFLPLDKIQEKIDPILSDCGLTYSWKQCKKEGNIVITCVVKHIDGHFEETELDSGSDGSGGKNTIQAIGSAVSYLKRYTLKNAFGLSEGDDDGKESDWTKEELRQMQKDRLVDLYADAEDQLSETEKARVEQIINKEEYTSYKKAIKVLEDKLKL